jgi:hypothetical protein
MVNTLPSPAYLDFVRRPPQLQRLMFDGRTPSADDLAGAEFRGTNLSGAARLLGLRRFVKGFERTPEGGLTGYNRRVRGADLSTPWTPSAWRGQDRFGFYSVDAVDPEARDNAYLHALLLDYSRGANPPRDPSVILRDYLVQVPDSEFLLGHAFAAIGRLRRPVGYFLLERL